MKRLEGEVRDALRGFGETQEVFEGVGLTVDPHQLLGIEINPRAAAIAELVLWIGYLQWHFRTFGARQPAEPIIKAFHNIECRDAVLDYERKESLLDENGHPVTRWDGRTKKKHPTTGKEVPDETATVNVMRYVTPRPTEWPAADYVVGNPPFIGNKLMRETLGDGYAETLRKVYAAVPDSVDYVMYWWHRAATALRAGLPRRDSVSSPGTASRRSLTDAWWRPTSLARIPPASALPCRIIPGLIQPTGAGANRHDGGSARSATAQGHPPDGRSGGVSFASEGRRGNGHPGRVSQGPSSSADLHHRPQRSWRWCRWRSKSRGLACPGANSSPA